jgi:hypothetical protein
LIASTSRWRPSGLAAEALVDDQRAHPCPGSPRQHLGQRQPNGEVDAELFAAAVILVGALAAIVGYLDIERLNRTPVRLAVALRVKADTHLATRQAIEQVIGMVFDLRQRGLNEQRLHAVPTASLFQWRKRPCEPQHRSSRRPWAVRRSSAR